MIKAIFLATLSVCFVTTGVSQTDVLKPNALTQLDAFTADLRNFSAEFEQMIFDAQGNREETSSGSLHISEPNLLRWEYTQPFPQLIIADGDRVWNYDIELEQITVRQQGEAQAQSPLTLLTRPDDLHQSFTIRSLGDKDNMAWLEMVPHAGNDEQSNDFAKIIVGLRDNQLQVMTLEDQLGQSTQIRFMNGLRNSELDSQQFVFSAPPDVDVLESDF